MVYLDTGFFVAYKNQRDKYHKHAQDLLAQMINGQIDKPYTCDYVLDEAVTATRNCILKSGFKEPAHRKATETGREIFSQLYWTMQSVPRECLEQSIELYSKHPECTLSFTDWVIYHMAKKYGQPDIITNDGPFAKWLKANGITPIKLKDNDAFDAWKREQIEKG
jgi:predicted nucleic acid-binding protein